ncbi:MAG: radical SAM family heme chaperone HemW [Deltaproteobacteria bacterium]|nr:radical SAM family heme chaperone HemW [Deltaproteobacteria bacterium]
MFTRLYLHIPFCPRKCPYCAFVSRESDHAPDSYVDLLLEEMRLVSAGLAPGRPLESIYFGGGTPSLLEPRQVALLIDRAARTFGLAANAEITLEVNPGTVDHERLAGFRAASVNRLSLGVQSFDERMLATLGRVHSARQAQDAFTAARTAGFADVGIDLIHALPGQTAEMWRADLGQALRLAPEHISVYGLSVEEGTPFAARYGGDDPLLPDDDLAAGMFEAADDLLTAHGYEHYEIANYALPGRRSRHNSGYWRRDGYLGLGAAAHSLLRDKGFGTRFGNTADIDGYATSIRAGSLPRCDEMILTLSDAMAEFMFLGLRLAEGVEFAAFEREFGCGMEETFGEAISELVSLGLLQRNDTGVRLTRRGMLLSNRVFVRFIA